MSSDHEIREILRRIAGPVSNEGVWDSIEVRAGRRRRFWQWSGRRLALATSALVALVALAGLGYLTYESLRPEPRLLITDEEPDTAGQFSDGEGFGDITDPEELWQASVAAVRGLGPSKVTMSEQSEGSAAGGPPQTHSVESVLRLDPANGRALLVVTEDGQEVRRVSMDGRVRRELSGQTYNETVESADPGGIPLPLPVGSSKDDYTRIFEGHPGDLLLRDASEGRVLSVEREEGENKLAVSVVLDDNLLPQRVEYSAQTAEISLSGQVSYRYEPLDELTQEQVAFAPPENNPGERKLELPLDLPLSPEATYGQYWLGPEFEGLEVVRAVHYTRTPGAEPSSNIIAVIYDDDSDGREDLQVVVHAPDSQYAKEMEQRVENDEGRPRIERSVAGKPAVVSYSIPDVGGQFPTYSVFLDDAFIDVISQDAVDPELVFDALRPVE